MLVDEKYLYIQLQASVLENCVRYILERNSSEEIGRRAVAAAVIANSVIPCSSARARETRLIIRSSPVIISTVNSDISARYKILKNQQKLSKLFVKRNIRGN